MKAFLTAAVCAAVSTGGAFAQEVVDFDGFYAGIFGSYSQLGSDAGGRVGGLVGYRLNAGDLLVLGLEANVAAGVYGSTYQFAEVGMQGTAGVVVAQSAVIFVAAGAEYQQQENHGMPIMATFGGGVDVAVNDLITLRIAGQARVFEMQLDRATFDLTAGVLFQLD